MTSWYVETFTLRAWLLDVKPALDKAETKPEALYFVDASQAALAAARRYKGIKLERLDFRMIDVRDDRNLLVRLRMAYEDLERVQADIKKEPQFQGWLKAHRQDRLPQALGKSIATVTLGPATLWRGMYIIQVAAWHARKTKAAAVLFLESRPWFSALRRYGETTGMRVRPARAAVRPKPMAQELLPPGWVSLGHLLRREGLRGAKKYFSGALPAAQDQEPKLMGEYWGQLNLGEPELNSDFFYLQESSLSPKDVIVGFTTSVKALDPELYADLRGRGLDAVATHPAAASGDVPLFLPSRFSPPSIPRGHGPEGRWLARKTLDYWRTRAFWRELFERRNVKIFNTWYKVDASHCAIADALKDVGGLLSVYQRSYEAMPTPEAAVFCDINFCYGRESAALLGRDGSKVGRNVIVGFIGDHRFKLLQPQAKVLRDKLESAGAKKIIAAYDENSVDDSRWHTGHDLQRSNYRLLCEKVLSEPWLGVIFKPKVSRTLRKRLGPVAELLAKAEATGRCHVFEAGTMYAAAVPAAAALAADVVVHGHLCGGTAAVEAALAGKPTLMVDQEGWSVSPMYRLGVGKVVFRNWEDVWTACAEHFKTPIPGFGDWSAYFDDFDPFRDGKAAHRMGEFLAWTLEGFKQGLDRNQALARASDRYASAWGADKVSTVG